LNEADYTPQNLPLTTVALGMATFMRVLDTTIANVSLPTIAGNLGVSYDDSTWVITSFTVCMAITLPLTGFLTRRFGEVKLFVWCTLLFSLASLACGLSDSFGMLLVCRAIQGAMSGPVYPVTQSLMIATYPKDKRGMALALIGMITIVAPIVGPVLGGWITDSYSWHWIFFINVPIGLFAGFVALSQLSGMAPRLERPRMDYVGLLTLIIGVGALQILLDKGNEADWFQSTFIVVLAIVAGAALTVFLIWELTDDEPIVDLRLFRHRNFAAGTLVLVLSYAVFFGMSLLLPLWTQRVLNYNAFWAGLAMAPVGIFPVLLTYFVGKYGPRTDLRMLAALAFVVIGATCM
jgi:DHA2 family multidrug resistance protein